MALFLTNFSLFYGFYISILDCEWHRWINIASLGSRKPFASDCENMTQMNVCSRLHFLRTGFLRRVSPKETEMLFRNDDMYISFWLNRYQTNKYNAARKKIHMIYHILKTIPFIFHPFQQLYYSTRRWRGKKCTKHGTRNKSFRRNQKNWMCFFCENCKKNM